MSLKETIDNIYSQIGNPQNGLPEEIFVFATKITPMINVDLLVKDNDNNILLSWRKTELSQGWHVIGGIIRLNESFEERIQKTALNEIGTEVIFEPEPIAIKQLIHKELPYRSHFITLIYECRLPEGFIINNKGKTEKDSGFLKWHKKFPEDMIKYHRFYKEYFS